MKLYVSCVLVIFFASSSFGLLAHRAIEGLQRDQDDCVKESGATPYGIEYAKRDRQIYKDQKMARFAICMLKKFNVMTEDGSINQDIYSYRLISDSPLQYQIADKCKGRTGKDVEETASNVMTCFLNSEILVIDPYITRSSS